MNKKSIIIIFLVLFVTATGMDILESLQGNLTEIERQKPGQDAENIQLSLDADGILKNYSYSLNVEAQKVTEKQAEKYFEQAKKEIEETFCGENNSINHIIYPIHIQDTYQEEKVTAEWSFDNYEVIDWEGNIREDALVSEGTLVNAQAELSCGSYNEMYSFAFVVYPQEKTAEEKILSKILDNFESQMAKEGEDSIELPQEIDGVSLTWKRQKSYYAVKLLVFGAAIIILLHLSKKEKSQKIEKERKRQMELEYPEIVSKMLILLGSGLSITEVWNKISAQYFNKREKKQIKISPAYEEILRTWREIEDGESERTAIQNFGKRTELRCYHRLSQLLIQSMEKGVKGVYEQLEQEAEDAFRERKQTARKMGEEASTKLLIPMVIMLGVVMAIIVVPAFLSF